MWTDQEHYREDMITEWIGGSDAIADAVIAQWVAEAAARGAKARAARASSRAAEPAAVRQIAAADAICMSYGQAAAMLGYSADHFRRHVLPDLRVIAKGRRNTVPRAELIRWVEHNSARALKR